MVLGDMLYAHCIRLNIFPGREKSDNNLFFQEIQDSVTKTAFVAGKKEALTKVTRYQHR